MAPVASGGPRGVPGIQAGSSPIVTQVRRDLGGENCPVAPTTGMCGPAALAPRGPSRLHLGSCPDGGGAGTEVHEQASACLWPAPNWWAVQPGVSGGLGSSGPPAVVCSWAHTAALQGPCMRMQKCVSVAPVLVTCDSPDTCLVEKQNIP